VYCDVRQVLQKERDALSAQLRGSGTAQVQLERLAAEVRGHKAGATDALHSKEGHHSPGGMLICMYRY
jgi:hypothetical protein